MDIGIDTRAAKWYRGTGIGTYSFQLIQSLTLLDDSDNFTLYMPENCNLEINLKDNVTSKIVKYNHLNNFWESVKLPNLSIDRDLDIYHVPQNGIGLPHEKLCPYVITLHDAIPLKMPETVSDSYLRLFHEEMPKIIPLCDGIITVSEHSKKDIVEAFNIPEDKVFVTYLASEPIYKQINKELSKLVIKKYYGIEGKLILYIGGFSPRKNILGIIKAFSKLNAKFNNQYKLVIAGKKGISYNIYKKHVENLNLEDKVLFPGYIEMQHIPYLYNASELFIYPSFYEGFGLPPIEAMACGIPVIASNTTSIPEILKDSCLYVDPYDIDDIYSKMYDVLTSKDLRNILIQNGFDRVSRLSWKETALSTLAAYRKICT